MYPVSLYPRAANGPHGCCGCEAPRRGHVQHGSWRWLSGLTWRCLDAYLKEKDCVRIGLYRACLKIGGARQLKWRPSRSCRFKPRFATNRARNRTRNCRAFVFFPLFMKVERVSPLTIHLNASNTNAERLYYL